MGNSLIISIKTCKLLPTVVWNKLHLPQMCCLFVFCAGFYAILSGYYIRKSVAPSQQKRKWKAAHFIACRPEFTPQIALSSQRKVLNRQKTNSSIKPNKFHSTYTCFGGRTTTNVVNHQLDSPKCGLNTGQRSLYYRGIVCMMIYDYLIK